MRKKRLLTGGIILTLTVIVMGVLAFIQWRLPVPQSVIDQTTFVVMVPEGKDIKVEKNTMEVSKPQGQDDEVLNYTATIDGKEVLVGQQPTPQQFIDIPKTYEKVVEQSNQYASFETTVGTVYLTRPQKQQIAMLNAKGTYMLAQASDDLTEDQWRRFFRSVTLVQ